MPFAVSRRTVNLPMDTLVDRMQQLDAAGWTEQLSISGGRLHCDRQGCRAAPEDVVVDYVFRFEGASDPGDQSILFALSLPCGHRGSLPAAYGKDMPSAVADVVTRFRRERQGSHVL